MRIIARRGGNIYLLAEDKTNGYVVSAGKISEKQPINVIWKWGYWDEYLLSEGKTKTLVGELGLREKV